jgi:hypothetical protein
MKAFIILLMLLLLIAPMLIGIRRIRNLPRQAERDEQQDD